MGQSESSLLQCADCSNVEAHQSKNGKIIYVSMSNDTYNYSCDGYSNVEAHQSKNGKIINVSMSNDTYNYSCDGDSIAMKSDFIDDEERENADQIPRLKDDHETRELIMEKDAIEPIGMENTVVPSANFQRLTIDPIPSLTYSSDSFAAKSLLDELISNENGCEEQTNHEENSFQEIRKSTESPKVITFDNIGEVHSIEGNQDLNSSLTVLAVDDNYISIDEEDDDALSVEHQDNLSHFDEMQAYDQSISEMIKIKSIQDCAHISRVKEGIKDANVASFVEQETKTQDRIVGKETTDNLKQDVTSEQSIGDSFEVIYRGHTPSISAAIKPYRTVPSSPSKLSSPAKYHIDNESVQSSIKSGASMSSHPSRWSGQSGIVCMQVYEPHLFSYMKECSRCYLMASEKDKKEFRSKGSVRTIPFTKGGCASACPYVDCGCESEGVRLCRQCFTSLHNNPQMEKRKQGVITDVPTIQRRSGSPTKVSESLKPQAQLCTDKFQPNIFQSNDACERCLLLLSASERIKYEKNGNSPLVTMTCGGCHENCPFFPEKSGKGAVRLCMRCFQWLHKPLSDKLKKRNEGICDRSRSDSVSSRPSPLRSHSRGHSVNRERSVSRGRSMSRGRVCE